MPSGLWKSSALIIHSSPSGAGRSFFPQTRKRTFSSRSQGGGPRGSAGRGETGGSRAEGSSEDVAWVDGIGVPEDLRLFLLRVVSSEFSRDNLSGFEVEGLTDLVTWGGDAASPLVYGLIEVFGGGGTNTPKVDGLKDLSTGGGGGGGIFDVVHKLVELFGGGGTTLGHARSIRSGLTTAHALVSKPTGRRPTGRGDSIAHFRKGEGLGFFCVKGLGSRFIH